MNNDLAMCYEKIHYANREINKLEKYIGAYLRRKPYGVFAHELKNKTERNYFFEVKQQIPICFQVAVGVILHLQRSSLDNLACVLAKRNSKTDKNVYFPIFNSIEDIKSKRLKEKIRKIDVSDREKILNFRPYKNGNNNLYFLHKMNVSDKHKRLTEFCLVSKNYADIYNKSKNPSNHIRKISFFNPSADGGLYQNGDLVASVDSNFEIEIDFYFKIAFPIFTEAFSKDCAITVLRGFSHECSKVLDAFIELD